VDLLSVPAEYANGKSNNEGNRPLMQMLLSGLLDNHRRLRFFWRAVLFVAAGNWLVSPLLERLFAPWMQASPGEMPPGLVAAGEFQLLLTALICVLPFALYERRRPDAYGLPVERALGRPLWEGIAAGVALAGFVAAGMLALGGMQVRGLASGGAALAVSALLWLGANILIGLGEEYWYRGYLLQALWRSLGFWPGALLVAALFTADHYFYKPGENIWDVITLVSLSLVMSYSVLKTGTLWFAVGFHLAFDYMQLFVIGTPNGGRLPVGRMLDVTFQGPAWLTGGVLGTEASFLMYPAIAQLWLYVWWRFRPAAATIAAPP